MIQREIWTTQPYFWDNQKRTSGDGIVIQQTLSGSMAYWQEGRRREVGEGQALLFRYGEASSYGLDEGCTRPYALLWAMITETPATVSLVEDLVGSFGPVLRMDRKGEAATCMAHLYDARRHGAFRDRFSDAEMALRLLMSLYREQILDRQGRDPVAYGRYLLETQFRSPRTLSEWAEEIGLTREHFTREFRRRYGGTPAEFLRSLRLQHARVLLANTQLTVEETALASGFLSVKTFHRAFRKRFGCSPGEARP